MKPAGEDLMKRQESKMGGLTKNILKAKALEIMNDCSKKDWDSYGANPVTQKTYEMICKVIDAMPANLPRPEIVPDSDGEYQLEWDNSTKELTALIEIAVDAKGRMAWAGTYERERAKGNVDGWWHGEDTLDYDKILQRYVFPQHLVDKIMRVMGEQKQDAQDSIRPTQS